MGIGKKISPHSLEYVNVIKVETVVVFFFFSSFFISVQLVSLRAQVRLSLAAARVYSPLLNQPDTFIHTYTQYTQLHISTHTHPRIHTYTRISFNENYLPTNLVEGKVKRALYDIPVTNLKGQITQQQCFGVRLHWVL